MRIPAFLVLAAASALSIHTPAHAQDATACAMAYVDGQRLRKKARLTEAHERLLLCSRDPCSMTLRVDCVRWLAEVDEAEPTFVIAARTPWGADATGVRMLVDGRERIERLAGTAVPIDPGPHALRFELDGATPIEMTLVAREGEKNRELDVRFAAPSSSRPKPTSGASALTYVLGGVGVALLAVGTVFEIRGFALRNDLSSCRPTCATNDVDSAKASFVVGDVLVGSGMLALGAAVYTVLARPRGDAKDAGVRFGLSPATRGAIAGVSGAF